MEQQAKHISIGSWLQSGSSVMAEIMAKAGFDWIAADLEHSAMGWEAFSAFVRAVRRLGVRPYARVARNDLMEIRKALDCGAAGIIVPLINNAQEAAMAVRAAKYPPQGIRGFAFCQANEWGAEFETYAAGANRDVPLFVMVESREAVEAIESILLVDGVDGVFIGPYDLSGSYGLLGQLAHPVIQQAKERVVQACHTYNKIAGQHLVNPTMVEVREALVQGYSLLALGMDTAFVAKASKEALEMRRDFA